MADTPCILEYTKIDDRLRPGESLWIAITSGSPASGGEGIVLLGTCPSVTTPGKMLTQGSAFTFGATADLSDLGVERNFWGLDNVPLEVATAWMKLKHQGKLTGGPA